MATQQLTPSNILLLGESCEDKYILGHADRMSPEAPVPVFKVNKVVRTEGMGSNVSKNLMALGNKVTFLTNKGRIVKTRILDERYNQQLMRIDLEKTVEEFDISTLPDLTEYAAVVISDYDKGFLPLPLLSAVTARANYAQCPVFVDTKKSNLLGLHSCFIKLNEEERAAAYNIDESNRCIVTLGSRGASWEGKVYPSKKVGLFDPTGAGDTFLSAFVSHYLSERDVPQAIHFANECAAVTVTKLGCYAVALEDINEQSKTG